MSAPVIRRKAQKSVSAGAAQPREIYEGRGHAIGTSSSSQVVAISRRAQDVPWSGIRQMFMLAARVPGAINLSVGQPGFDTPPHIVDAAKRALDEGYTAYAPALGLPDLREAIARKVWRENRIRADPETEVLVTVGAIEGIALALLALVDPGDEVIIPDPGYPNYEAQIRLVNGIPTRVPVHEEDDFRLVPDEIEKAITNRTRVLIMNSPANPTGAVLRKSDLQGIAEIARRHNLAVISDEPYERLVYGDVEHVSIASLPGMKERTVSIYSLSKTYAMTGWRIGFAAADAPILDEMHKMQQGVASCVASFVQKAAVTALDGPQDCVERMVAEYDARRKFMVKALNAMQGVVCPEPQGAFYLFPNVSSIGLSSFDVATSLLQKERVVCVPGTAFGPEGEGYLRISYAGSAETLKKGVERIAAGLDRLRKP